MNLNKKTDEWVKNNLLSPEQQSEIMAFESGRRKPFRVLSILWLGIFSFFLGIISLVADYWDVIPDWAKLTGAGILLASGIGATVYFFKKEKHLLAEVGLFFTFLMIGGGIGLIAQIFNLPVDSGEGFLAWAALSLIIVLMSRRELLPLLWIPLFLGGVLGYMRLELLLLFFTQTPLLAVSATAGLLFGLIYVSGLSTAPFLRAVNRWAIVLYYAVLILGEDGLHDIMTGFGISIGFLAILAWYAMHAGRVRLFNWTLFFIAVRLVILYFQVFESLGIAGMWLTLSGLVILGAVGIGIVTQKRMDILNH